MVRIRHERTDQVLDVTKESLPYYPDYKVIDDEPEPAPKSKPTTPKE